MIQLIQIALDGEISDVIANVILLMKPLQVVLQVGEVPVEEVQVDEVLAEEVQVDEVLGEVDDDEVAIVEMVEFKDQIQI
ncbi:MAG: hypothetical protein LBU14_05020 [Candidatus Peribacteria bacterium]|nr:hypothetical protein [Candidatus Peribacteria bacterium]